MKYLIFFLALLVLSCDKREECLFRYSDCRIQIENESLSLKRIMLSSKGLAEKMVNIDSDSLRADISLCTLIEKVAPEFVDEKVMMIHFYLMEAPDEVRGRGYIFVLDRERIHKSDSVERLYERRM